MRDFKILNNDEDGRWKNLHINGQIRHNGGRYILKWRGEGNPFQSNFGDTKGAQQNFHLLTQCIRELAQDTLLFFLFETQNILSIKNFMWCIYILSFKPNNNLDIGQKPYWSPLFFFTLNYKPWKNYSFVNVFC